MVHSGGWEMGVGGTTIKLDHRALVDVSTQPAAGAVQRGMKGAGTAKFTGAGHKCNRRTG